MSLHRSNRRWSRRQVLSRQKARSLRPEILEERLTPAFTASFAEGELVIEITGNDNVKVQAISRGGDGDGIAGNVDLIGIEGLTSGGFQVVPGGTSTLGNTLITDVSKLRVVATGDSLAKVISIRDPRFSWNFEVDVRTGGGNDSVEIDTQKPSFVDAGAGNDKITSLGPGNAARDELLGGDGLDEIFGGDGDDVVDGGTGTDRVNGQSGNDLVIGGPGLDILDQGTFFDRSGTRRRNSIGNDVLEGGAGDDTLTIGGDTDSPGNDTASGGDGDDLFQTITGTSRLAGGPGNDRYQFSNIGRSTDPREYTIEEEGEEQGQCLDRDDLDFATFFDQPFSDTIDLTSTLRQEVRPLSADPGMVFGITLESGFAVERLIKPGEDPIINPNCLIVGPDLLVRKINETGKAFLGDNVRTPLADERQSIRGVSVDGRKVTYEIRLQNDGGEAQQFLVKAPAIIPAGLQGLTQEFFVDSRRITSEMATGFLTPEAIQPGEFLTIRAEVAMSGTFVPGLTARSQVQAFATTGDTTVVRDLVTLETTFGLIVNSTTDEPDPGLLADGALDALPDVPGDQVTLRAAIDLINAGFGNGEIRFGIPENGNQRPVIETTSANGGLKITRPFAAIRGQTQPGSFRVELDLSGLSGTEGLVIDANVVTIQGLVITGSKGHGITVLKPGNQIGGALEEEGNVISGNKLAGVVLKSSLNVLRNNVIGIHPDEALALPNGVGILDEAGANSIGFDGVGNVISGNAGAGLHLNGSLGSTVAHNKIGSDLLVKVLPNEVGILLTKGKGTIIDRNEITSNREAEIRIDAAGAFTVEDTLIVENTISKVASGLEPGANHTLIRIEGSTNTRIGQRDDSTGQVSRGNRITGAGNVPSSAPESAGISAFSASGLGIFGNVIVGNRNGITLEEIRGALIQGNRIGADENGVAPGNTDEGIDIIPGPFGSDSSRIFIGGVATKLKSAPDLPLGPGNVIASNGSGIAVSDPRSFDTEITMPTILSNTIFDNETSFRVGKTNDRPAAPVIGDVLQAKNSLVILGFVETPNVSGDFTVLVQFLAHKPGVVDRGPEAKRLLGNHIMVGVKPNLVTFFEAALPVKLEPGEQVTAITTLVRPGFSASSTFSKMVAQEAGIDSDGDGLIDRAEGILDSNGDGVSDAFQQHVLPIKPATEPNDQQAFSFFTSPQTPFVSADQFSSVEVDLPPGITPFSNVIDFTLRAGADGRGSVQAQIPKGKANRYIKLTQDPETGKFFVKRLEDGSIDFLKFDPATQTGTIVDNESDPAQVIFTLLLADGLREDEVKFGEFDGLIVDPGIFVLVPETDVELKLAAPPRSNVGESVAFTFDVANKGTELADNLLIEIVLPADVEFIGGGVFDAATRRVLIDAGDLIGGASTQRSLVVKPTSPRELVLTAELRLGGVTVDPSTANNQAASNPVSVVDPTPPPPPPPPPSAISARKQNRRLVITGSGDPDALRITLSGTSIMVTPLAGSLINGRTSAQEFVGVSTIDVSLLGGNDTVELVGAGFRGQITLRGGPGDDIFRLGARGARARVIDTEGRNRIGFSLASQGVRIDLLSSAAQRIDETGNTLELHGQFQDVTGSPFRDFLRGRRGWHKIVTGGGADRIVLKP